MGEAGTGAYGPGESMLDQLARVRLWLARHQILYAERELHPDPRSRHMFVSDAEFRDTLRAEGPDHAALEAIERELEALAGRIEARVEETLIEGGSAPLEELRAAFRLSDVEVDVIVALAAPEIEQRLARAYTNAWSDFTLKQVEVAFLMELLGPTWARQQELREALSLGSRLDEYLLIHSFGSDKWAPDTPLLYRRLKLSDRLVDFLLTGRGERLDRGLGRSARLVAAGPGALDGLLMPEEIKRGLVRVLSNSARERGARVALISPPGCGRKSLAAALAGMPGRRLLVLDARRLPQSAAELEVVLRTALRDAHLARADLYLDVPPSFCDDRLAPEARQALIDLLGWMPGTVYIGAEVEPEWLTMVSGVIVFRLPFPTVEVQEALWRRQLAGHATLDRDIPLEVLVSAYSLSGGAIEIAAREAIHQSRVTGAGRQVVISRSTVTACAQEQLSHRLGLLAEKVTQMLTWNELVLPDKTMNVLKDLVAQYRNQNRVFNEWGFNTKVAYGRGLTALFHGPPGTGKTMVAGIIARELGLELYKIDLSRVVDKYIGETEKNLGRIFDEATRSRAILLFDEADSLFSKRTQVKSSHDRYANLETNYLLQRLESYEGVALLTTNFEASLDEAFKRRLRFKIAFPFPDAKERGALWEAMMPGQAYVEGPLDFGGLGEHFEMTGGHIKNAMLRGAFSAAQQGSPITASILYEAATEEYREMGKLVRS